MRVVESVRPALNVSLDPVVRRFLLMAFEDSLGNTLNAAAEQQNGEHESA